MRVVIIVNPVSGRRKTEGLVRAIGDRLQSRGVYVDVHRTQAAGDAARIARAVGENTDAVLAVGGDGTVREVATGLVNRPIPLMPVPAGTENLVARQFKLRAHPTHIVDTVLAGRTRPCDVGVINDRYFLIVVGVGFDAEVVADLTRNRTGHISRASYFGPLWRRFWGYQFGRVQVEIDGRIAFDDRGLVFAGVLAGYGGGLRILRHAVPDDGLLDVCILRCPNRLKLVSHASWILAGLHTVRNDCIYLRCKKLRVSSREAMSVQADGDAAGTLPVSLSILPGAISFLVPK